MLWLLAGCGADMSVATPPWLLGRWHVAFNPGHDANDVLQFQTNNRVKIETEAGQLLKGFFQIEQDELILMIDVGRRNVEIRLRISASHEQLIFSNGAYYLKVVHQDTAEYDKK